jgi:alpha-glucoside transport system substrate-binding protein
MIRKLPHLILAGLLFAGSALSADLKFKPGADPKFSWDSYNKLKSMNLSGEKIAVFGPWLGPDKELIESVVAYFEEATGATVNYAGSDSFEQQIVIDLEAGSPPNIAIFPQPGLASDLASKGHLAALDSKTRDWIRDNYAAGQSWVDLGTFKGKDGKKDLYGFFYKVDVKSLVW